MLEIPQLLKANFATSKPQKSKRRFYYNEFTVFVIFNDQIFADTEHIRGAIKFCICKIYEILDGKF